MVTKENDRKKSFYTPRNCLRKEIDHWEEPKLKAKKFAPSVDLPSKEKTHGRREKGESEERIKNRAFLKGKNRRRGGSPQKGIHRWPTQFRARAIAAVLGELGPPKIRFPGDNGCQPSTAWETVLLSGNFRGGRTLGS